MRNFIEKAVLVTVLGAVTAAPVFARGAGTTSAAFLKLGIGARANSMANAYGAVATGPEALFWNPAGISAMPGRAAIFLSRASLYGGELSHETLGAAVSMGRGMAMGLGGTLLNQPSIEGRDNKGNLTSNFNVQDSVYFLGLSGNLGRGMQGGVVFKRIESQIGEFKASSIAMDAGIRKEISAGHIPLKFGLAVQNMGNGLKFRAKEGPLPLNLKFSGAVQLGFGITIVGEMNRNIREKSSSFNLGAEYSLFSQTGPAGSQAGQSWSANRIGFDFRMGFLPTLQSASNGFSLDRLRAGFGIRFRRVGVDYAFLPSSDLGQTHKISLRLEVGGAK